MRRIIFLGVLGCLMALPAPSAIAGDYNIAACTSGTKPFNQGGWASAADNRTPSNSGDGYYINHNEFNNSSFRAGVRTFNQDDSGYAIIAGVSHSPIGSYIDGCPGIQFGNTASGLQGVVARPGANNSKSGVGGQTYTSAALYAPSGGSIVGMSGNLYTLSIKDFCGVWPCNSQPRAVNNISAEGKINQSDYGWNGRWFQNFSASSGHGGGAPPAGGVGFVMVHTSCDSSGGCLTTSTGNLPTRYLRAASQVTGDSQATMRENNAPDSVSASGDLLNGWVRGTKGLTVYSTDPGAGTAYTNISFDAGRTNSVSNTQGCDWGKSAPCPTGQASNYFSFDTNSLSNGQHTLYAKGVDYANNSKEASYTVLVDNQEPLTCGSSLSIPAGNQSADGRRWLRSTVNIETSGCDAVSGLAGYRVEYQTLSVGQYTVGQLLNWPGSWQNASGSSCSSSNQTSGGQSASLNCSFNTASFPDGTAIRFRSAWVDKAGNPSYSSVSDVRYLDNTAPVLTNTQWQAYKTSDGSWQNITNGWTNAKKTRLTWDPISAGNGSPINKYFYSYESDLEQSGSGACATQQPDGWLSAVGVTQTPALDEERSEECRQGKHQVWVWVQDIAGNGAVGSPPSSFKNAAAGTSQVSYDSVPTAETRDLSWAKSDSLMPTGLTSDPGEWSLTNNFTLRWTNPIITNTVTQSPIDVILYQVGGRDTVAGSSIADVQTYSSCIGSGAQCALPGIKAPSEGSHPVRVWARDAAGNSSLEQSAAGQINWRKNRCVTP